MLSIIQCDNVCGLFAIILQPTVTCCPLSFSLRRSQSVIKATFVAFSAAIQHLMMLSLR